MRISDWSSDVCSSDLRPSERAAQFGRAVPFIGEAVRHHDALAIPGQDFRHRGAHRAAARPKGQAHVGRGAACRMRDPRQSHQPTEKPAAHARGRSEEHTSELQSLMRISYAVFCLKTKKKTKTARQTTQHVTTTRK